jgi:hypothetical protein
MSKRAKRRTRQSKGACWSSEQKKMRWLFVAIIVTFPTLLTCYSFYESASQLVDIDKYCQADRPNNGLMLDHNLRLRQVHIFTRHGDRTPLRGFQKETNISWEECHEQEILHLTASSSNTLLDLPPNGPSRSFERTVEIPQDDLVRRGYWTGNCNPGQLTTKGHRQLRQVRSEMILNQTHILIISIFILAWGYI